MLFMFFPETSVLVQNNHRLHFPTTRSALKDSRAASGAAGISYGRYKAMVPWLEKTLKQHVEHHFQSAGTS